MTGAFSDGLLTNRINWVYRNYYAENSADDFVRQLSPWRRATARSTPSSPS